MSRESETDRTVPATDADLLQRFIKQADEAAFGQLVDRHAPLVLGVCRRVLSHTQDAEDAFQATFSVLASKADRIHKRRCLASWLYGVAYRISLKSMKQRVRLGAAEMYEESTASAPSPLEQLARRSDEETIDLELSRLPSRYRDPLILQYIEGRTRQEIARELGISVTAVEGRLKRGRAELRRRLVRRGITMGSFAAVIASSQQLAARDISLQLIDATVRCSSAYASGAKGDNLTAYQLAQQEITEMTLGLQRIIVAAAVATVAAGLGLYGLSELAAGQTRDSRSATVTIVDAEDQSAEVRTDVTARSFESGGGATDAPIPQLSQQRQTMQRIEHQLDETVQLDFIETPLTDVLEFLSQALNIPIVIDDASLDDIGLEADGLSVTLSVRNGLTARSALRLILDSLELEYALTSEVLLITTIETAEELLDVRVYSTGRLQLEPDALVKIITGAVQPESWIEVGGPGVILAADGQTTRLVIAQTQRVHEQIEDLLDQLARPR